MDHRQTLPGYDGLETKSLTPISRSFLFTELFGLDHIANITANITTNDKTIPAAINHILLNILFSFQWVQQRLIDLGHGQLSPPTNATKNLLQRLLLPLAVHIGFSASDDPIRVTIDPLSVLLALHIGAAPYASVLHYLDNPPYAHGWVIPL